MTFSELVLLARQRLHDYRKADGTVISSASDDGIRWSSDNLVNLCKQVLSQVNRTLHTIKGQGYVNRSLHYQIVPVTIDDAHFVQGLPEGIYDVRRLQELTPERIYDFIDQEEFLSKRYRASQIDASTYGIEGSYFSVFSELSETNEATLSIPVIREIPIEAGQEVNAQAIIYVPLSQMLTLTSTAQLPFVEIDDLLLDYIEREARDREAFYDRSKILDQRIMNKLMELGIELQRDNR